MTLDPIFTYDPQRKDVSNVRDLSNLTGLYDCERDGTQAAIDAEDNSIVNLPFVGNGGNNNAGNSEDSGFARGIVLGALGVFILIAVLGIGIVFGRRSK